MGAPKNSKIPPEVVAELKKTHPKLAWRKFGAYEILFRPMSVGEWEKFKQATTNDQVTALARASTMENLHADHMVYPAPGSPEAEHMFEDMPALKTVIGNEICKRAGVTVEVEEGEF